MRTPRDTKLACNVYDWVSLYCLLFITPELGQSFCVGGESGGGGRGGGCGGGSGGGGGGCGCGGGGGTFLVVVGKVGEKNHP